MIRLLVFIALGIMLFVFFRWLSRQPPRVRWQSMAGLAALVLLLLVVTGRAHWLAAVFAALLPFLRGMLSLLAHIPVLQRVFAGVKSARSSAGESAEQTSTVTSLYIRMTLNHATGDINGEVLVGQFKGTTLDQLALDQLLLLLNECQHDEESAALLHAYLDRVHGDSWRGSDGSDDQRQSYTDPGPMSREEALQVLGLPPDPSDEEIIQAHRQLIRNLHPDRGGSDYLAAKVNLAKEVLLAR